MSGATHEFAIRPEPNEPVARSESASRPTTTEHCPIRVPAREGIRRLRSAKHPCQVVRSRHRQSAVSGHSDENSVVAAMEGGTVARSRAV